MRLISAGSHTVVLGYPRISRAKTVSQPDISKLFAPVQPRVAGISTAIVHLASAGSFPAVCEGDRMIFATFFEWCRSFRARIIASLLIGFLASGASVTMCSSPEEIFSIDNGGIYQAETGRLYELGAPDSVKKYLAWRYNDLFYRWLGKRYPSYRAKNYPNAPVPPPLSASDYAFFKQHPSFLGPGAPLPVAGPGTSNTDIQATARDVIRGNAVNTQTTVTKKSVLQAPGTTLPKCADPTDEDCD
jgi:hypothetical protein